MHAAHTALGSGERCQRPHPPPAAAAAARLQCALPAAVVTNNVNSRLPVCGAQSRKAEKKQSRARRAVLREQLVAEVVRRGTVGGRLWAGKQARSLLLARARA